MEHASSLIAGGLPTGTIQTVTLVRRVDGGAADRVERLLHSDDAELAAHRELVRGAYSDYRRARAAYVGSLRALRAAYEGAKARADALGVALPLSIFTASAAEPVLDLAETAEVLGCRLAADHTGSANVTEPVSPETAQ